MGGPETGPFFPSNLLRAPFLANQIGREVILHDPLGGSASRFFIVFPAKKLPCGDVAHFLLGEKRDHKKSLPEDISPLPMSIWEDLEKKSGENFFPFVGLAVLADVVDITSFQNVFAERNGVQTLLQEHPHAMCTYYVTSPMCQPGGPNWWRMGITTARVLQEHWLEKSGMLQALASELTLQEGLSGLHALERRVLPPCHDWETTLLAVEDVSPMWMNRNRMVDIWVPSKPLGLTLPIDRAQPPIDLGQFPSMEKNIVS